MSPYGATIEPTGAVLDSYAQVANAYLSSFQSLGSIGLFLGTLGVTIVMLRNLAARRFELMLLTAIGFSPLRRLILLICENALLLVIAGLVGLVSALAGLSAVRGCPAYKHSN